VKRKSLALIPARSGSKGIPKKNLVELGGHPLIAWSIMAARKVSCFDSIIVSTDDKDIATISRQYGAEVPFLRPSELARDNSLQVDTIKHSLEFLQSYGQVFDCVMLLQPTFPFRNPIDCEEAINLYYQVNCSTVVSVTDYSQVHSSNLYLGSLDALQSLEFESNFQGTLRQNLPKYWWRNGGIYALAPERIIKDRSLYSKTIYGYEIPRWQSHNIDSALDLVDARFALFDERILRIKSLLFGT